MAKTEANLTTIRSTLAPSTTLFPDSPGARTSVLVSAIIVPIVLFVLIVLLCVWINKKGVIDSTRRGKVKSTYEEFSKVDNTVMLRNSTEVLDDGEVESIPIDTNVCLEIQDEAIRDNPAGPEINSVQ